MQYYDNAGWKQLIIAMANFMPVLPRCYILTTESLMHFHLTISLWNIATYRTYFQMRKIKALRE
jgi:hypothetical protein